MIDSITVKDNFCTQIEEVRQSAFDSGFGTWKPNKGEVGSSIYEGMNFWGKHGVLLRTLSATIGRPIFPNNMFFRLTRPDTESAYVHSDRNWGHWTCIVYLSEHKEVSGTGFYRHRATGLKEMPTFESMKESGLFETLKSDMVNGSDEDWEQLDFIRGMMNRALIFYAPLFHSRVPKNGLGMDESTGRLVWVCHFEI